jgi:hypothetical protein
MIRWYARRPDLDLHEGILTSLDGIARRLNLHGIRQTLERLIIGREW